jgi:hypothetical protein
MTPEVDNIDQRKLSRFCNIVQPVPGSVERGSHLRLLHIVSVLAMKIEIRARGSVIHHPNRNRIQGLVRNLSVAKHHSSKS